MAVSALMTADDLLRLPDDGSRYELVRGELRKMSPASEEHSHVALQIASSLNQHVKRNGLGRAYGADGGFGISRDPDTVLSPDAAFVRAERVAPSRKYFDGAPDAAFEVISPADTYTEVQEKTARWLRGGCRVVVVVDPRTRRVHIHRPSGAVESTGVIAIDDVVPGWTIDLREIFE